MGYYSQCQQDQYLNENLFLGKENGFFIDIGAHNGIFFSNTLFFEQTKLWNGICVEPNPDLFGELTVNRKCKCINACIAAQPGMTTFLKLDGYCSVYGGITDNFNPLHIKIMESEIARCGAHKELIQVNCITLGDLLDAQQVAEIDYCSLDIEGGELDVLKSIDYFKWKIDTFTVENNYYGNEIRQFMESVGYHLITTLGPDEIYKRNS